VSNETDFALTFAGDDLDELNAVREFLRASEWEWGLDAVERRVGPAAGYRFRARVRADETTSTAWVSGDFGLLAEMGETFPGVRVAGRFRDRHGAGSLDGVEKDYDRESLAGADDEDAPDDRPPLDPAAGLVVVRGESPLSDDAGTFADRLEAIAALLTELPAVEVGCTVVGDDTAEWTASGQVEALAPAELRELCRDLRRLRVPLDVRVEGPGLADRVWPVGDRPWRSIF